MAKNPSGCYAHQHLRPQEFGLYEVCLRLTSGGKKTLFFDGRSIARMFRGASRSSIYRYRDCLIADGWLKPLNLLANGRTPRKPNGQNAPTEYHIVSHAEWVVGHGTQKCIQSRPWDRPSPADETGPVPKNEEASPKIKESQSQNSEKPVPPAGHNLIEDNLVKENSIKSVRPNLEEVVTYCRERGNHVDPQKWFDHYSANGWRVGRNSMKDWRAAVRTWERNGFDRQGVNGSSRHGGSHRFDDVDYTKGLDGFIVGGGQ